MLTLLGVSKAHSNASTEDVKRHDPSFSQRCPRLGCLLGTLELSLGGPAKDLFIQRQVRYGPAKSNILRPQLLQSPDLATLKAAICVPPSGIGDFPAPDRRNCIRNRPSLGAKNVNLSQLRNNLFHRVSLPCHRRPPLSQKQTSGRAL